MLKAEESEGLDNSPHSRRIVQALVDLRGGGLEGARILDLGSAHGQYTIECARRGAICLGLEGRQAWVDHARSAKDALGLENARFEQFDVRRLCADEHGVFDVTLCLGLLYHLDAEQALRLLTRVYAMTKAFIIVDTQIALSPQEAVELDGRPYHGATFPEHPPGTSPDQIAANLGAALDGESSFWFTLPSLLNLLGDVGFTSAYQLQWPADHLIKDGEVRMHEDYVTIVAFKGERISDVYGAPDLGRPLLRLPEDMTPYYLDRPSRARVGWSNRRQASSDTPSGATTPTSGTRSLKERLAAAARAFRA